MTFDLRPIDVDEFPAFSRAISNGFGGHATEEQIEDNRTGVELDRTLAAFDDGQIVGTGGIFSFQLTVPGHLAVPAAGVSMITVLPTHRRRGILTSMMARLFRDIRERGEPIAMLFASESSIYGRYGYGISTRHAAYKIDPRHAAFDNPPDVGGRIRLVTKDDARMILPDVYERFRLQQPGALSRSPDYWKGLFIDPERRRHGASAFFYVVREAESGEIDGYMSYRTKGDWHEGFPQKTLMIGQIIALNREARFALWQYALNVDLMSTVEWSDAPGEEPIRWTLSDFRRLRTVEQVDSLWVRIVDVPEALSGRRYSTDDRIVLQVRDAFCPDNNGCYELEGSPAGAVSRRSRRKPDLELSIADLGAVYLGGVRFSTLADAFRVTEHTPGALRRADLMFSSDVVPWCTTGF